MDPENAYEAIQKLPQSQRAQSFDDTATRKGIKMRGQSWSAKAIEELTSSRISNLAENLDTNARVLLKTQKNTPSTAQIYGVRHSEQIAS